MTCQAAPSEQQYLHKHACNADLLALISVKGQLESHQQVHAINLGLGAASDERVNDLPHALLQLRIARVRLHLASSQRNLAPEQLRQPQQVLPAPLKKTIIVLGRLQSPCAFLLRGQPRSCDPMEKLMTFNSGGTPLLRSWGAQAVNAGRKLAMKQPPPHHTVG